MILCQGLSKQTKNIFYAQGYSGVGVGMSAYVGQKLSQLVAGEKNLEKHLPIFQLPSTHSSIETLSPNRAKTIIQIL